MPNYVGHWLESRNTSCAWLPGVVMLEASRSTPKKVAAEGRSIYVTSSPVVVEAMFTFVRRTPDTCPDVRGASSTAKLSALDVSIF